jgi:hypothetical protein
MECMAAELSTPEELLGVQPVLAASRAAHPKKRRQGVNFMRVRVGCKLLGRQGTATNQGKRREFGI